MSNLWVGVTNGVLGGTNPAGASALLSQELGIKLQKSQEKSIMNAIQSPQAYVNARGVAIDTAVNKAGDEFSKYQIQLLGIGVPTDTARAMALKYAGDILNSQMGVWNIENPGFEQAFRGANIERGYEQAQNILKVGESATQTGRPFNTHLPTQAQPQPPASSEYKLSKADKRAIKDRALGKYKAKKRAKKVVPEAK